MNCRTAQEMISAERDGALDSAGRAGLDGHLASCEGCRRTRAALATALDGWKSSVAAARVPDEERAWQDLRREIRSGSSSPSRKFLAWSLPLAAAAAVAMALFFSPAVRNPGTDSVQVARADSRADFVEVPKDSSSVVYRDDQSGWLVVWAVDDKLPTGI